VGIERYPISMKRVTKLLHRCAKRELSILVNSRWQVLIRVTYSGLMRGLPVNPVRKKPLKTSYLPQWSLNIVLTKNNSIFHSKDL
jgi:hypothetical protein